MNKLRPLSWLGQPFHGLAVDGVLATSGSGNKTVYMPAAAGSGTAIVQRNPRSGRSRNLAQTVIDSAAGYEWRDYLLLCGPTKRVNGSTIELGANAWLYSDANGRPWIMTLEQTRNGGQLDLELWRRDLFGQTGRLPSITDELIASLAWVPTLPSWYAGGHSVADFVDTATANGIRNLVISPDGSDVIANVTVGGFDVVSSLPQTRTTAGSLIGVLRITVGGNGNPLAAGFGVTGTIAEESNLAGLVSSITETLPDTELFSWDYVNVPPISPEPPPTQAQVDAGLIIDWQYDQVVANVSGDGVAFVGDVFYSSTATCYRTFRGDITRQLQYASYAKYENTAATGTRVRTTQWRASKQTGSEVLQWDYQGDLGWTGYYEWQRRVSVYQEFTESHTYLGHTEGVTFVNDEKGPTQFESSPDQVLGDAGDDSHTVTCNGLTYPTSVDEVWPKTSCSIVAPNLFCFISDFLLPDEENRRTTQKWIGDGESAAAQVSYDQGDWYQPGDPIGLPGRQYAYASFQPVTMEFAHSLAGATGPRYQYV